MKTLIAALVVTAALTAAPSFADQNSAQLSGSVVSWSHYTAGDGTGRTSLIITNNGNLLTLTCGAQLAMSCETYGAMDYVIINAVVLPAQVKVTSIQGTP